jgi:predicted RNA methylase
LDRPAPPERTRRLGPCRVATIHVDRLELATVRELVELSGKRVLEMGCGDGRFTYLYARDAEYVLGIDPKRDEVAVARGERPAELARRVQFRVAKTITPPRRPFDVALFSWSL